MLASYYANCLNLKTAVIELNGHKDLIKMCGELEYKYTDIRHFSYKNVDFHTCNTTKDILKLSEHNYEVQVIDMDYGALENFEEFLRCDIKIVVCSAAVWKIGAARKLLMELNKTPIKLVTLWADKKTLRAIQREFNRAVTVVPQESNPFRITSQTMLWIKNFLGS